MTNREFSPFHPHLNDARLRDIVFKLADVADRLGGPVSWERLVTVATSLGVAAAVLDATSATISTVEIGETLDWFAERVHAVDAVRSAKHELAQAERALAEFGLTQDDEPF